MKEEHTRNRQQEKSLYQGGWILFALLFLMKAGSYFADISFRIPPCLVHKWTGYYCPGCGGTRAVKEFLQGHFLTSFFYHPVVLYGGLLYVWFMISHTIEYLSKGKLRTGMRYSDYYMYIAIGIILLQWLIKNIVKAIWGIGLL